MWIKLFACVLVVVAGPACAQMESRVVSIKQGLVRGYRDYLDVISYYGIPYATTPKGADKFKAPLPAPVWGNNILEATNNNTICPQLDFQSDNLTMTEDCLVANVYVPISQETHLPVIVFVHGGAYLGGSALSDSPKNLVNTQKVIAVNFNYRLNVHGFLCLGTEDAPGNAGMKDQVALLRWVKENIASFGGNPNDVTITGCSAGGSAVDLLMISKITDGLFNKVISNSGCGISTFGTQLNPLENAKLHARLLNATNVDDIKSLAEFYKTHPLSELIQGLILSVGLAPNSYFYFQPCIERDMGQEMFLDDAPINIYKKGDYKKLPVVYGYANMEGLFRLPQFYLWKDLMNEKFSDFLPADLQFESDAQKEEVALSIKNFYFGDKPVNESTILQYIELHTDLLFLNSIYRTVTLQVQAGNNQVYLYDYSFVTNSTAVVPHTDSVRGVDHCFQTVGLMDVPPAYEDLVDDELLYMANITRQLWINFITTGNPTPPGHESSVPTWLPAGENRSPHLSIGQVIQLAGVPAENRSLFWDGIYERHYRMPMPPPNHSGAAPAYLMSLNTSVLLAFCVLLISG